MSDTDKYEADARVDALVRRIVDAVNFRGNKDNEDLVTVVRVILADLTAANARIKELEAMCEWLAGKVSDRDALAATRDGGSFRSPDEWLAAARAAVKEES